MLYKDSTQPADDRAKDLLARMSLPEKLAQLRCVGLAQHATKGAQEADDQAPTTQQLADGIGFIARTEIVGIESPAEVADSVYVLQRELAQTTRHGIPALVFETDMIGGFSQSSLVAAAPIALAATFSPKLVREFASLQRHQARSLGSHMVYGPALDVLHERSGDAIADCFGDNPYLVARMGVAAVRGLQGELLRDGVAACVGHFLGGGGKRKTWPLDIGPRQLRERFAEPFAAAIRDADLAAVQLGSHSVDGLVPSVASQLIVELLRDDLGFEGITVSDAIAMEHLIATHRLALDQRQASARAMRNGVDAQLPDSKFFEEPLQQSLGDERIDSALVNQAVRRVLLLKFRLGLFEIDFGNTVTDVRHFAPAPQRELTRRLTAESSVLLCNDGVLPLQANAAAINPLTSTVTSTTAKRFVVVDCAASGGALRGLRSRLGDRLDFFSYDDAQPIEAQAAESFYATIEDTVSQADVVLICLTCNSAGLPAEESLEGPETPSLPPVQRALLTMLARSGAAVVSLLFDGLPTQLAEVVTVSNALLLVWPGHHNSRVVDPSGGSRTADIVGGEALVDLLLGASSPAGRLPFAVPLGAREPLFSFGWGLSYSQFEYANLQCPETVDTHGVLRLSFDVSNRSGLAADEVVQVYVVDLVAKVRRPSQQLVGFNRVHVRAGETVTCKFRIDPSQLAYFDGAMKLSIESGDVGLSVGGSAIAPALSTSFRVTGPQRRLSQRQIVATQVTGP